MMAVTISGASEGSRSRREEEARKFDCSVLTCGVASEISWLTGRKITGDSKANGDAVDGGKGAHSGEAKIREEYRPTDDETFMCDRASSTRTESACAGSLSVAFKRHAKEQWGRLTDDDLAAINGRREQLEGKLQERYGYAKDRIRREIDDWASEVRTSARKVANDADLSIEVEAIRDDVQKLAATIGDVAKRQAGRAQDNAVDAMHTAENYIRTSRRARVTSKG